LRQAVAAHRAAQPSDHADGAFRAGGDRLGLRHARSLVHGRRVRLGILAAGAIVALGLRLTLERLARQIPEPEP
jgi:hypothetical protein